ncbi:HD domain-containing protein [Anaerocolumna sp. AGMB13025]|uniref:HD domain-containing phosphohydrolase n=1 Tax=Anaerocolumna sp. AGMB13025 TaxID=3039116 RepID=UPI00241C3459|nr:HD domain-containing phosphohydrolase [Anaerocolumna sp. AGMB13025]WFR57779.1 HD domain-containing protein [Anaerocolumna sp. AGMB13025]
MQYKIKELFDLNLLDKLLHDFYKIAKVPISIVDISGEVVVCAGWKTTCSNIQCKYEEIHTLCLKEYWKNNADCLQCEREVSCLCGLKMYRIPVYIIDTVIANIFLCENMTETPYNSTWKGFEKEQKDPFETNECSAEKPDYLESIIGFIENHVILISNFLSYQLKDQEESNKLLDNYAEMKLSYEQLITINNDLKFNLWELQQRLGEEDTIKKQKISANEKRYLMDTVTALGLLVEKRDLYTARHQKKVAYLACKIAARMKLEKDCFEGLYIAAMLHDIGKIGIPSEVLSKPDKLSEAEFELIKTHVQNAYDILSQINFPWPVADIVLQHHEKLDGSGYPHGLKDKDILLEAKIISVADVVEAITAHRPYKPALGISYALKEIKKYSGIYYDAEVVDACIQVCTEMNWNLIFNEDMIVLSKEYERKD